MLVADCKETYPWVQRRTGVQFFKKLARTLFSFYIYRVHQKLTYLRVSKSKSYDSNKFGIAESDAALRYVPARVNLELYVSKVVYTTDFINVHEIS